MINIGVQGQAALELKVLDFISFAFRFHLHSIVVLNLVQLFRIFCVTYIDKAADMLLTNVVLWITLSLHFFLFCTKYFSSTVQKAIFY